ncbi:MAG: hypothetical protein KKA32_03815 [Actinobacteria bacterium]|nr:hypothetical protein [Actinomycetota bacterium]
MGALDMGLVPVRTDGIVGEGEDDADDRREAEGEKKRRFSPAHAIVNVVLLVVALVFAWVVWQEVFSPMPSAEMLETGLAGSTHLEALREVRVDGKDVVLTYDLTDQPYFDEQQRYAGEFEETALTVLDEFRRVQRVRISILQGPEKYEGLSVTDGFGVILEWF